MESPDSATTGSQPGGDDRHAEVVAADGARALVVIPTYNEKDNLPGIIGRLNQALPGIHVLVKSPSSSAITSCRLAPDWCRSCSAMVSSQ